MNRWIQGLLLSACALMASAQEARTKVVFLNPGFSQERFWADYTSFMRKAASDLNLEFDAVFGERNTELLHTRAREILAMQPRPDYLIFTNEHFTAPEVLRLFAGSGVKMFMLHSTLNAQQQALIGSSREKYPLWIGTLVPNDEEAGYLMGKGLLELNAQQPTELLAFTGIKQTPSATLRLQGLQRALADEPNVHKVQALYGEWSQQRAYEQARALLPRYPNVTLVWAANDEMAFGVKQAADELGRTLSYTALNNSDRVFEARANGAIEVLATGHFLLGACALVMLHDHSRGVDFAAHGGKDQTSHLLRLVNAEQARYLQQQLAQQPLDLDFKQFSAFYNRQQQNYNCSIDPLLTPPLADGQI